MFTIFFLKKKKKFTMQFLWMKKKYLQISQLMQVQQNQNLKKKKKIKTFIEPSAATEKPSEASEAKAFGTPEDDGAVVAAIVAAIRAMRAEEGNTGAFRVVAFKRADSAKKRRM